MAIFTHAAIDIGTSHTKIYIAGKGIVLNEPTLCAVRTKDRQIVAYGSEALHMAERAPAELLIQRPMLEGIVHDPVLVNGMIRRFADMAMARNLFPRMAKAVVAVPSSCSELAKSAIEDAVRSAGFGQVRLTDNLFACAMGAGYIAEQISGVMVVDLGAGLVEAGVISCGGPVTVASTRCAGEQADNEIVQLCRERFDLAIGNPTAQLLKHCLGGMNAPADACTTVKGRCISTGLPKECTVTAADVADALKEYVKSIIKTVREVLGKTPPELCGDLMSSGILLTGGGAAQGGLTDIIAEETGLPVRAAEDGALCCITGAGKQLKHRAIKQKEVEELPALPMRAV